MNFQRMYARSTMSLTADNTSQSALFSCFRRLPGAARSHPAQISVRSASAIASSTSTPRQRRVFSIFELHGPVGLLLHDCRPVSDRPGRRDVTDLHSDNVAAAQLAVDCQIEECLV
jgi:hypothetical protein